jgi:predicted nucleic acid-binding protein
MFYIDTSVFVSALTREADTVRSQDWLARQDVRNLAISDWTETEFASALSIKLRAGHLSPEHRAASLASFSQLAAESLRVLPVTRTDFRLAARYADRSELNLRAGDALHLAICVNHGANLCTLDRRMAEAASRLALTSVSPIEDNR